MKNASVVFFVFYFTKQRTQRWHHQYTTASHGGLLRGFEYCIQLHPGRKVNARIQRVIRRALLTLNFNGIGSNICVGKVQIDSLEPTAKVNAERNVVPDKAITIIVVVFNRSDLISINRLANKSNPNLVASLSQALVYPHARPNTTPHTTPARLTRLSLRALALRRALGRATWYGLPRACTSRARRRGRSSPRKRRWVTRAQRVIGHVQRIIRKLALCYEHECAHGRMARG
jgi:hypothetical protein